MRITFLSSIIKVSREFLHPVPKILSTNGQGFRNFRRNFPRNFRGGWGGLERREPAGLLLACGAERGEFLLDGGGGLALCLALHDGQLVDRAYAQAL